MSTPRAMGVSSFDATNLLKYVFKTLLCWNVFVPVAGATDMCFTSGEEITATGAKQQPALVVGDDFPGFRHFGALLLDSTTAKQNAVYADVLERAESSI